MAELSYLYVTYIVDPPMLDIFYIGFVLLEDSVCFGSGCQFSAHIYKCAMDTTGCVRAETRGVRSYTTAASMFSQENQLLWELKTLIISSLQSICGRSRKREEIRKHL